MGIVQAVILALASREFLDEESVSFQDALGLEKGVTDDRPVGPRERVEQVVGGHVVYAFMHQDVSISNAVLVTVVILVDAPSVSGVPVEGRVDPAVLVVFPAVGWGVIVFAVAITMEIESIAGLLLAPFIVIEQVDLRESVVVRERGFRKQFL